MVSPTGDRDVDVNVRLKADEKELNKTKRMLENFRKSLGDAVSPERSRELQRLAKEFAALRDNGLSAGHAALQLKNRLREVGATKDETAAVKAEYDRLTRAIIGTRKAAEEAAAAKVKAAKEAEAAAERAALAAEREATATASGTTTRGSVGNQLLRNVGNELRGLPAIPIPGTNISTETPARVLQSLGRLDVGLRDLAIGGGLAAAAVVGVALAMENYKRTLEPVETLIKNIVNAQREVAGLVAQNDPAAIVSRREQASQELIRLEAERNKALEQQVAQARHLASQQAPDFLRTLLGGNVAEGLVDLLSKGPLEEATAAVDDYNAKIAAQQIVVDELNQVIDEANRRLEAERIQRQQEANLQFLIQQQLSAATIQTTDDLNSRTEALDRERALIEQALATYYLSDEAQEKYRQRLDEINLAMGALDAVRPQVAQVEALARAEEDRKKAEEDLLNLSQRAIQIQEQGQQRLAALAEQSAKQLEAAEKRVLDSVTKLADFEAAQRDKRTEAESDFMDKELERTRKYRKDLEKLQRDSDRRLLELLQDKEDAQFEAELANDVAAFLRAERNFERQSEREKSRLAVAEQDRLDAFNEESRRNQQMLTEKIAAIDTETAKKREALLAEIAEQEAALEATKAQIAAKQAAEEAAIKKSLNALVKGFDTSSNAMVATIEQGFKVLEAAGINTFTGIIGHIQSRAQSFYSSSNPASGGGAQSNTPYTPGVTPLVRLTGFAEGTLSTRAVFGGRAAIAAVNDHPDPSRDEAIIPYRRSVGLASELQRMGISGGSSKPNVTVYVQGLAPGVTPADLKRVKDTIITAVMMADHASTTGVAP